MKSTAVITLGVACIAGAGLRGQATFPFITELKQNYTIVKNNHLRMAAKMPEEHYSFRPVAEVRSFGEALAHVAEAQARTCSLVRGDSQQIEVASTKTKADLVAALAQSFAVCDAAFDALTAAGASHMVRLGQSSRERSRLGLLAGMTSHSNEQYGYLAMYLRLKGLTPPSSEPQ